MRPERVQCLVGGNPTQKGANHTTGSEPCANPDMVFTSIGHLINRELMEENLDKLAGRLKQKSYKPQPARRVEIEKDNGKTRPLSIYCYEDKLVQEALKRVIEAVFESHFYDEMWGFRLGRGCHGAIQSLNVMLEERPTNYVLDADIKGFFDHIDHEWAVRFIESRIKDLAQSKKSEKEL